MSYRARRADLMSDEDCEALRDLHELTFGDTAPVPHFETEKGAWWLLYAKGVPEPVAFCGVVPSSAGPGYAYLKRAGVVEAHRGKGLQRRMIRLRVQWAKRNNFHTVITDTCNVIHSTNNLIRAGFLLYEPSTRWSLKGALYLKKRL